MGSCCPRRYALSFYVNKGLTMGRTCRVKDMFLMVYKSIVTFLLGNRKILKCVCNRYLPSVFESTVLSMTEQSLSGMLILVMCLCSTSNSGILSVLSSQRSQCDTWPSGSPARPTWRTLSCVAVGSQRPWST